MYLERLDVAVGADVWYTQGLEGIPCRIALVHSSDHRRERCLHAHTDRGSSHVLQKAGRVAMKLGPLYQACQ